MYTIGVVLPNTKLFGGVRRFFELGEHFISHGHQMIILTPEGEAPDWFNYKSTVDIISNLDQYHFSVLFITEIKFLNELLAGNATLKVFYHILESEKIHDVLKHPEIKIFANSANMALHDKKKYGIETVVQQGGVNLPSTIKDFSKDDDPFVVMCFGRLSRKKKGTMIVVKAAERIYKQGYKIKLLLFDTPTDEKSKKAIEDFKTIVSYEFVLNHPVADNESLFKRASVFVSAEKRAGWSNASAEALSCGIPLIATLSGTRNFLIDNETGLVVWRNTFSIARALKKMIKDKELRMKLSVNGRKKIEEFSWTNLAVSILNYLDTTLKQAE